MTRLVAKRYAAERRFRLFGLLAVGLSVAFLAFLLITMGARGLSGFTQSQIRVDVDFARSDLMLDPAAHKWVRVGNEDIGEPGCKHWHVVPRLGVIGMLAGWWHVKISSGCPFAP